MRRIQAVFTTVLLSAAISAAAHADIFSFTLTGSRDARFLIDISLPPSSFTASALIGDQFAYNNVSGVFNGASGVASAIGFGQAPILSDFQISGTSLGFTQFSGPTLFTGTTNDISFLSGTYALTSIVSGASTLLITDNSAVPVPEPASWLMLTPFAAVVVMLRTLKRRAVACA